MQRDGVIFEIRFGPSYSEGHSSSYSVYTVKTLGENPRWFRYYSKKVNELEFFIKDHVTFDTDIADTHITNIKKIKLCAV